MLLRLRSPWSPLAFVALFTLVACNGQKARDPQTPSQLPPPKTEPARPPPPEAQELPQERPLAEDGAEREVAPLPSLAPLVEAVKGAVVNVDVQARQAGGMDAHPFFGFPMPGPQGGGPGGPPVQQGAGSGSIIDPRGRVLTNHHVIAEALSIQVRLEDGRSFRARVLGSDPLTDLALLELEGVEGELPYVKLGDSDALRVGDYVVAIGNPFGLASSVSAGIISARERNIQAGPYDDFLQTDAAINPGNSGGPLFNLRGEVVGVNTAIVGGGTGIGFAVPSRMAKLLLPQLEEGVVRRGWLGVAVQDLTPELAAALGVKVEKGAVVSEVTPDTPAAKAGLKADDVIIRLDGEAVESAGALTRAVGFMPPGKELSLTVVRDGEETKQQLTLGERPDLEGVAEQQRERREAREALRKEGEAGGFGLTVRDARGRGMPPGALVVHVETGSRAERAGFAPGMVIVEAGGKNIRSAKDLMQALKSAKTGDTLLLRAQVGEGKVLRALPVP